MVNGDELWKIMLPLAVNRRVVSSSLTCGANIYILKVP
ncbi:MAG: hypothetical protein JWN60_2260 [Acidobacteria bacterium]|nr:hypothetical protein [Acidobacteriota bacterium]